MKNNKMLQEETNQLPEIVKFSEGARMVKWGTYFNIPRNLIPGPIMDDLFVHHTTNQFVNGDQVAKSIISLRELFGGNTPPTDHHYTLLRENLDELKKVIISRLTKVKEDCDLVRLNEIDANFESVEKDIIFYQSIYMQLNEILNILYRLLEVETIDTVDE